MNKEIYSYSKNNIIYRKQSIQYTVRQFTLFFFLLKYITYCLIVFGCVAKGSYFSVPVHHKFSIFEIKYVKKRGKFIFCLAVYYPPLLLRFQIVYFFVLLDCLFSHTVMILYLEIKARGLELISHLMRSPNRKIKRVIEEFPNGRWPLWLPWLTYMDSTHCDLQTLGYNGGKPSVKAVRWHNTIRSAAKSLHGLWNQYNNNWTNVLLLLLYTWFA